MSIPLKKLRQLAERKANRRRHVGKVKGRQTAPDPSPFPKHRRVSKTDKEAVTELMETQAKAREEAQKPKLEPVMPPASKHEFNAFRRKEATNSLPTPVAMAPDWWVCTHPSHPHNAVNSAGDQYCYRYCGTPAPWMKKDEPKSEAKKALTYPATAEKPCPWECRNTNGHVVAGGTYILTAKDEICLARACGTKAPWVKKEETKPPPFRPSRPNF